jgi:dihydroorotase
MRILITGGHLIDPANKIDGPADLVIKDNVIESVGGADSVKKDKVDEVIDAKGMWVTPGLIDIHVHFREPGFEKKETILTGSKAAILGGYTTVCCMPNTNPVNDSSFTTLYILERAKSANLCRVLPIGAVSKSSQGKEMAPLTELANAGCVAFSDDGEPIYDSGMMRRALEWASMLNRVISCHEEDKCLCRGGAMNDGPAALKLGIPGIPGVAEDVMIARDIELARFTGAHAHICHVSTARGVELIRRAKKDGIKISCEVTPHHLHLTEDAIGEYNTNAKMNPPLRRRDDVDGLIEGIKDGTIDAIASDHAPHDADSKGVEFTKAAMGILGLQTSLPLSLDFVRDGTISRTRAVELLSTGPARAFGLKGGALSVGSPADILVLDPEKAWSFDVDKIVSKSLNSPFIGRTLKGMAREVWVDGDRKLKGGELCR